MPIHDWSRVEAGIFHHFHQGWTIELANALNGGEMTAYVEPVSVGDLLPSLPIFLDDRTYVPAPLESTYQATWDKCPNVVKELVESGGS